MLLVLGVEKFFFRNDGFCYLIFVFKYVLGMVINMLFGSYIYRVENIIFNFSIVYYIVV